MAGYERQRNDALAPVFALTRALGAFPPAREFLEMQAGSAGPSTPRRWRSPTGRRPRAGSDDEDDLARVA